MADALGLHSPYARNCPQQEAAVRHPIDAFIHARLEREGLAPAPEADRRTLLRRLSFDLTGLPPTLAEIDAFLKDKSPDAYEKQVDRLLASPHYGERMAMDWLDVARYADTHGYHIDSHRDMWPWRDWLINAFNSNMPFDRSPSQQLAGDLLPDGGHEGKIASGFNRNHMINFEGGAIAEEYLHRVCRRPRRDHRQRVDGPDDGLRAVPHAQVRSHLAQGVLPASSPSSTTSTRRASTAGLAMRSRSSSCRRPSRRA